jgi:hypothetical protein
MTMLTKKDLLKEIEKQISIFSIQLNFDDLELLSNVVFGN